jgi:hypothetical protein
MVVLLPPTPMIWHELYDFLISYYVSNTDMAVLQTSEVVRLKRPLIILGDTEILCVTIEAKIVLHLVFWLINPLLNGDPIDNSLYCAIG